MRGLGAGWHCFAEKTKQYFASEENTYGLNFHEM